MTAQLSITVPSDTVAGKTYDVKRGRDGVWYCSCPAWKFQRVPARDRLCKHITKLATDLGTFVGRRLETDGPVGRRAVRR